jgi:hypothetical protein
MERALRIRLKIFWKMEEELMVQMPGVKLDWGRKGSWELVQAKMQDKVLVPVKEKKQEA